MTEASTISGDPSNGTVTYTYDELERLKASTLAANPTVTYGWDADVNRTSVAVSGGSTVTTTYDAADRPKDHAGVTDAFASDADGRLLEGPDHDYEWDDLGRLTKVKPATGGGTDATYSYDPLDRLRLIDHGGSDRTRLRYVGLTTNVAQLVDDQSGTVELHVANGWTGERLADWTGSGSNLRLYGTNGHHDVTWLASSAGTVSQGLRYDPWGTPRTTVPTGYSPFRFQGSLVDDAADLAWVVTRWYAPAMGRFISEDTLLGEPIDPPSRHLYAYGAGEPIGRWDPDGRKPKALYGTYRLRKTRIENETRNQWKSVTGVFCTSLEVASFIGRAKFDLALGAACAGADVLIDAGIAAFVQARSIVLKKMWITKEPGRGVRVAFKRGVEYAVNGRVVRTFWPKNYTEWAELHFNYLPRTKYGISYPSQHSNAGQYERDYKRCVRSGFDDDWLNGPFWRCYEGAFAYRYIRYKNPVEGRGRVEHRTKGWPGWYVEGNRRLHPGQPDRNSSWEYKY